MKQRNLKLAIFFGMVALCLNVPSVVLGSTVGLNFKYQTFILPQSQLFNPNKKASNRKSTPLFVASFKEGILYAGNRDLGRCMPLEDKGLQTQEPNALKNGILQCKNLSLKVKNGVIVEAFNQKRSQKLNLKPIDSFTLKTQEVLYQYPKKSQANPTTNAQISTRFYCSNNVKIQKSLEVLYGEKFNCKNAQKVFLGQAQDSMQKFFEDSQQEIEEFLKTSSFEQYHGSFLHYFDKNLLVFSYGDYLYSGGAHGIKTQWGVILSRKNNKVLNLEEIIDFKNPKLKSLLWEEYQNYQKKLGEAGESYVNFDNFKVSKAVLLDYDSFIFIYQPYEIMPYAYGIIELNISLDKMAEFVQVAKTPLKPLFAR